MRIEGIIFLAVSWTIIIGLNVFCLYKIFNVRKF